ncbi:hypothetical protein F2Q69_00054050 [Brassica cretica]|uniref:Uncharacterized protein n=1 Tax=Brassica cretica TaxID=69181 RepID=A0A8S9N2J4_BRACR|nr:hypothetical protein F2Q69_00054050 [Brassica cretica]
MLTVLGKDHLEGPVEMLFPFHNSKLACEISVGRQVSPTRRTLIAKACCFNLPQEPILSEALKEPIAFVGGMFAGLLRLDLNDEPLKEWVTRTVEASGITEEDVGGDGMASNEEESPQQIEIE